MSFDANRRDWLAGVGAAGLGGLMLGGRGARAASAQRPHGGDRPFRFSLNTSTIQGQKVPLAQEVEIAAKVGYDAIEPWTRELDAHVEGGGSLADLGKKIADLGLEVPSAIGFFEWCVDDEAKRQKALAEARRVMTMVKAIGGQRIAAPPLGLTDVTGVDLRRLGERYRTLCELGAELGVQPELEVWGFSKTLSRLSEAAFVATEAEHPQACILADIYHLHKGGSGFGGLHLIDGLAMPVFHMNDYPASPPREMINDADRVYPGDGVAPLAEALRTLQQSGFHGFLSLELFNREYWTQDPTEVARTGLGKMKAAVAAAGVPVSAAR